MYYVLKGYCSPDHHTCHDGPVLELVEFKTAEQVEKDCLAFEAATAGPNYSSRVYRVFKGEELKLTAVDVVTRFKLSE